MEKRKSIFVNLTRFKRKRMEDLQAAATDAPPLHPVNITSQDPPPAAAAPPHQQAVITVQDSQHATAVRQTGIPIPVHDPTLDRQLPQTLTEPVPQGQTEIREQMAETMTDDERRLHPVVMSSQDPPPAATAPPHQQAVLTEQDSQPAAAVRQTGIPIPVHDPTLDRQLPQTSTEPVPQGQTEIREQMAETLTDDERRLHPVVISSQDPPPAATAPPHEQVVIVVQDSQPAAAVQQTVITIPVHDPTLDPQVPPTPTEPLPQGQTESREQMAETMTDDERLRIIAARRQPKANPNPPPVIPFKFTYVLWVSCIIVSAFLFMLCNMCYVLHRKYPDDLDHGAGPPFSLPHWGKLDERIRVLDVYRSFFFSCIGVSILCETVRRKINGSHFQFSANVITVIVYIKAEVDIICGLVLSNYLGHHTPAKEDLLIAFAITGGFCLVSSCLALVQLPNHEGLFSVLCTLLTSGISYAVSKSKWHVVCLCGICQVLSFALYLPIVLYKKGWVQITFGCVFFSLLIVLLSALPSVAARS